MSNYEIYNDTYESILNKLISENKNIDLIIIDPPYEQDNHGGGKSTMAKRNINKGVLDDLSKGFDYEICFEQLLKVQKITNMFIFCSNKQISKTMSFFENKKLSTTLLVWQKTNPIPFGNGKHISDCEFIIYVRGKGSTFNNEMDNKLKYKVKTYPTKTGKNRFHKCEKPVELLKDIIKLHSKENDIVLDCFMGSGSTGVASMECNNEDNKNRYFIGVDLDSTYYDISKQRLEEICLNE